MHELAQYKCQHCTDLGVVREHVNLKFGWDAVSPSCRFWRGEGTRQPYVSCGASISQFPILGGCGELVLAVLHVTFARWGTWGIEAEWSLSLFSVLLPRGACARWVSGRRCQLTRRFRRRRTVPRSVLLVWPLFTKSFARDLSSGLLQ